MAKADFPNTYQVANRYGDQGVKQMKARLIREGKGGGELEKSIRYKLSYTKEGIEVKFLMSKSADRVENGRKPYGDDKTHDPPVVKNWSRSSLKAWLRRRRIPEDKKFAVARAIGRYGIEPVKFRFVTVTLWKQYRRDYEKALAKDYELHLQEFVKQELKKAKKK